MPAPTPPLTPWLQNEFRMGTEVLIDTKVTYNGFVFPPATEARIQIEPVYESSGRVPKWWKHTLTLEFTVVPQTTPQGDLTGRSNVDVNVETLKRLLLIPGAVLTFSLQGLGSATRDTVSQVYTVTADKDLNFGPKPMLWNWESIGGNRAVRVQWSVEFCLSVCCFSDSTGDGICDNPPDMSWSLNEVRFTEFNYSISLGVDEEGFVTRSLVGTAEVQGVLAHTRLGTGLDGLPLPANQTAMPDVSRFVPLEKVQQIVTSLFPVLAGFRRSYQWDVSRDGRTVDWRITDVEIRSDNPLLPGILKIRLKHDMSSKMPFGVWDCTISGSFTLMPNTPKFVAWSAFLMVVKSRLAKLRLAAAVMLEDMSSRGTVTTVPKTPCYIPWDISISEDVFDRTVDFSLKYQLFCSFQTIFENSGMFEAIAGTDWQSWKASLPETLKTGRGSSQLSAGGPSQNLVVICTTGTSPTNNTVVGSKEPVLSTAALFYSKCPPPENSWADYKVWFEIRAESNVVEHQKAYGPPVSLYEELGSISASAARSSTFPQTLPSSQRDYAITPNDSRNVQQGLSTYSWLVILHGYALRLCYDVPLPELVSVGGVKPFHVRDIVHAHRKRMTYAGPAPLYGFAWSRYYRITAPLSGSITVNNTFTGNPQDFVAGAESVHGESLFNNVP